MPRSILQHSHESVTGVNRPGAVVRACITLGRRPELAARTESGERAAWPAAASPPSA